MAKQNSNNKQLTAQDVYQLVSATLQEHFQLDMKNRDYTAQDIWDVLVAASVERISIEMASQLLEEALKGCQQYAHSQRMLKNMGELPDVEKQPNNLLTAKLLLRKLLKSNRLQQLTLD
ncbi:MAG: hypothetical protein H6667_26140 [Ardenticatenaceae bacterium]|nr:hypothetical protein [Ardenticatenaceae bacterium]